VPVDIPSHVTSSTDFPTPVVSCLSTDLTSRSPSILNIIQQTHDDNYLLA
jgi:hypothetical protein